MSSESNLQLLLHAGELEYIIDIIKASRDSNRQERSLCVGGCLFGLWRNSLKQPVIQFVTGPDKNPSKKGEARIKELFKNSFTDRCAQIITNDHQLLHLGFWFYGEQDEENKAKEIALRNFNKSVLLLVSEDGRNSGSWSGQYHLRFKNAAEASSLLYREDVLDGQSSFRVYERLTNKIKDSKFIAHPEQQLERSYRDPNTRWAFLDNLPSRVQVEEAVTSEEQWYSTDEGMAHLQRLFQYFKEEGITPDMSRDTATQDMQFGFDGGYSLDFPAKFPKKMPEFHIPGRGKRRLDDIRPRSGEDVCAVLVRYVVGCIRQQSY